MKIIEAAACILDLQISTFTYTSTMSKLSNISIFKSPPHTAINLTSLVIGNLKLYDAASNLPITGIWITQINCAEKSIVEAPGGCNQFYFGKEGIIKTFNFEGVQYLAGQNYKMCIRSEAGACYVAFEAETNHFMLQVLCFTCKERKRKVIV